VTSSLKGIGSFKQNDYGKSIVVLGKGLIIEGKRGSRKVLKKKLTLLNKGKKKMKEFVQGKTQRLGKRNRKAEDPNCAMP